jgi:hypothetical protein
MNTCQKCLTHIHLNFTGGIDHLDKPSNETDETFCMRKELEYLREWKAAALKVESEWDPNHIAGLLGGQPGESQRMVIMREVPKLIDDLNRYKRGIAVLDTITKLL